MLHYVHQLPVNFVFLLFAAEQVQWVYQSFYNVNAMRAVRVTQNSKVAGQKTKTVS